MNNQVVSSMLLECESELSSIRALLIGIGEAALPTPYIKKYAVIRATGILEIGFKTIIADRVDRDSHQQLKNFVAKKIRNSSTNPRLEAMENLLKEFDAQWRTRFREKVAFSDKPALDNALNKLVDTRNSFAHGGLQVLPIEDTLLFFKHGCEILRILDETVHEEAELPEAAEGMGIPSI